MSHEWADLIVYSLSRAPRSNWIPECYSSGSSSHWISLGYFIPIDFSLDNFDRLSASTGCEELQAAFRGMRGMITRMFRINCGLHPQIKLPSRLLVLQEDRSCLYVRIFHKIDPLQAGLFEVSRSRIASWWQYQISPCLYLVIVIK